MLDGPCQQKCKHEATRNITCNTRPFICTALETSRWPHIPRPRLSSRSSPPPRWPPYMERSLPPFTFVSKAKSNSPKNSPRQNSLPATVTRNVSRVFKLRTLKPCMSPSLHPIASPFCFGTRASLYLPLCHFSENTAGEAAAAVADEGIREWETTAAYIRRKSRERRFRNRTIGAPDELIARLFFFSFTLISASLQFPISSVSSLCQPSLTCLFLAKDWLVLCSNGLRAEQTAARRVRKRIWLQTKRLLSSFSGLRFLLRCFPEEELCLRSQDSFRVRV